MATVSNPLSGLGRSTADVAAKAAQISIDSAERTLAIQLEYARGALQQATLNARAFAAVKDLGVSTVRHAPRHAGSEDPAS